MTFDFVVIGNGIFGKLFLYELNKLVNKSKNFSIAHVYNEELAPACSLRTTSTVSLNGIEGGISLLGDELRNAFFAFQEFYLSNPDSGIFPVKQIVTSFEENEKIKMQTRYGDKCNLLDNKYFNKKISAVTLDSYIVIPNLMFEKINSCIPESKIETIIKIVRGISKKDENNTYEILFADNEKINAKKIIIATGAYSKIFPTLFENTEFNEKINFTKIVAGSYLFKKIDLPEDIYLTIDGHNLVYRKKSQELIIGSTTVQGAILAPDIVSLKQIFESIKGKVSLELGQFTDYEIITGLRHKGQKRLPFFKPITNDECIWFFNGAYKNGWSLPFYYIKRDINKIFSLFVE